MTVAPGAPASASRPTRPPVQPDQLAAQLVESTPGAPAQLGLPRKALMARRFAYFMSELLDERRDWLIVEDHHEEWCDLMQWCPLLCLLAPRDHGKTWTAIAYLLWRVWRHNRDPDTGELVEGLPEGRFQAVLFSDTKTQAEEFFEQLQALALANEDLFGDILPTRRQGAANRTVWSRTRFRLRNLAELSIRAFKTSTRGLHPDVMVLDDVLNDQNTLTAYQRDKSWRYFVGTLLPMNASQYIVIGTALHYDDLLHRLKPVEGKAPMVVKDRSGRSRRVAFRWVKYRAVNWTSGAVLWPWKHDLADLEGKRDFDSLLFSREYQNDPRDDASSLFPYALTNLLLNKEAVFYPLEPGAYRPPPDEACLLGMDIAASESVGADFTVIEVASVNRHTMRRRLLWAHRERGMGFDEQIEMLRRAYTAFGVQMGIVEQNTFQRWLVREAAKYPELAGRVVGHNTGTEKRSLTDGVPGLKLGMQAGLWEIPAGDEESRAFAAVWQSEFSAFGWKDDKLQGVGEHDDCVMSTWFLDLAARQMEQWLREGPTEQVVTATEEDFEPVAISREY